MPPCLGAGKSAEVRTGQHKSAVLRKGLPVVSAREAARKAWIVREEGVMRPVFQTVFDDRQGDCFAACLASILEVPLVMVPNFRAMQNDGGKDMVWLADEWLREKYRKRLLGIEIYHPGGGERTDICLLNRLFHMNGEEFVLLSGESPRKNADGSTKYHCVVGKADCWGFELAHDPHPEGGGIVGQPYGVKWIVAA